MKKSADPADDPQKKREVLLRLIQALNEGYSPGVDRILEWQMQGNQINGRFLDGSRIFSFTVSRKGMQYQPVLTQDAYNQDRENLWNAAWIERHPKVREDAAPPKEDRCKVGYNCGKSCISLTKVCRIDPKAAEGFERLNKLIDLARSLRFGSPDPRRGILKGGADKLESVYQETQRSMVERRLKDLESKPKPPPKPSISTRASRQAAAAARKKRFEDLMTPPSAKKPRLAPRKDPIYEEAGGLRLSID